MMNTSSDVNPLQGLYISLAVMDSKMQNLQAKISCLKENNVKYEKSIKDDQIIIEKLEKDIHDYSLRESKLLANIDNLRQTKKFQEDMETNLRYQLVMLQDKNEASNVAQRNLLATYYKIADEYQDIYNSLPSAKERNLLRVEKQKKIIEIERLKKEYNDFKNKIKLFNNINDQRLRLTIISFVKALVERNNEVEKTKMNLEYEKKISEEIEQLEDKIKILRERLTNKAKDTVAKIKERTVSAQSRYTSSKISTSIFNAVSSVISIKERLGLGNRLNFYKRVTTPSQNNLSFTSVIGNESSEVSVDLTKESSSEIIDKQMQTSMTQLNSESDKQKLTAEGEGKESIETDQVSTVENEDIFEESTVQKEIQSKPINTAEIPLKVPESEPIQELHESPLTVPTTAATIVERNNHRTRKESDDSDELRKQKNKPGIKRTNISLGKVDHKDVKKIRRVTFKSDATDTAQISNLERNFKTPMKKVVNKAPPFPEPPAVLSEPKAPEMPEPQRPLSTLTVDDHQANETEPCIISSPDTSTSSVLPENIAAYDSADLQSLPVNEPAEEDEEVSTPQMSSYFLSPTHNPTDRSDLPPFSNTSISSRNEDNPIYNSFPMSSANPQINLSPPFSRTSTGNKDLGSFFGTPSSNKGDKAKSFFDLF